MENSTEQLKQQNYTVSQWCKKHSWPPEGGLRHLIFHSNTNGFNNVIRRVGRRVLINEKAFFEWVDKQNPGVSNGAQ